jgi:hypothetical protein
MVKELRRKYARAAKREKGRILDQLESMGYNRSYGRRLMREGHRKRPAGRRGAPATYGAAEQLLLRQVWMVSDCLCGKRLAPILSEYVRKCVECGEITAAPAVCAKVSQMSAATIDRLLARERAKLQVRSRARTKPGTLLREHVPIRTYSQWEDVYPGDVALDCVGHDGGSTAGDYCQTLVVTDVATGWTELRAVRNKAQVWVFEALKGLRADMPFPLHAIHSDNGGEFINGELVRYCHDEKLHFTRSRAERKNDNCYVEQKNWSVARRAVGYDRYEGTPATNALNRLYALLRLHVNFLQPSMKLKEKQREGSTVRKRHHTAATPYQQALDSPHVAEEQKDALRALYATLNPAKLKRDITRLQRALRPHRQRVHVADASPELVASRLRSASAHLQKRRRKCA